MSAARHTMWWSLSSMPTSQNCSCEIGTSIQACDHEQPPASATREWQAASKGDPDKILATCWERAFRVNRNTTTPSSLSGTPSGGGLHLLRRIASAIEAFS